MSHAVYAGHLADGSSVQRHSAGPLYPNVLFVQETPTGRQWGVIGPKVPDGELVGTADQAEARAKELLA